MKILTLHCDHVTFKANKKAFKNAPELSEEEKKEKTIKECLLVLTSIENGDTKETLSEMVSAVKKTAGEVKANKIVVYPYAHLSSNLSDTETAFDLLKEAEKELKKDFEVVRAPFGYYKEFEFKCKGHPLSELSKSFDAKKEEVSKKTKVEPENYDVSKLLREINKTKLDTSKLKTNDHRILAQKLDLFSFNDVAPGMVFWHDNGFLSTIN